ncbi:MAG: hypothetical protein JXX29_14940, partial [Deltaproteobacteria bacterium]|nr:hypothetical protein [Deltaproteobacteria bacterium]
MRLFQRSLHHRAGYLEIAAMLVFGLVVAFSTDVRAEGTYQTGADQDLFVDDHDNRSVTELKVDILALGEVINIVAGNNAGNTVSVTITNPDGEVVVNDENLTNGNGVIGGSDDLPECPITDAPFQYVTGDDATDTVGVYLITFDVSQNDLNGSTIDPFDITVTAATDDAVFPCAEDADGDGFIDQNPTQTYYGGRLHTNVWSFNGNGYENTTDADFYVLVPGGRDGENYTWMLDLTGLGGYYYEIAGNITGVNSPNDDGVEVAGFSVPMDANSYDPLFELYLAHPSVALPPGEPPVVSNFRFYDDDAEDNSISPGNQDTVQDAGDFIFESDIAGTYAIFIDGDDDGIYDPTTIDDILLSGEAQAGENTVYFDGNDNTGNPMQVGVHLAMISLRAGEYHFVGTDIEYCSPGIRI